MKEPRSRLRLADAPDVLTDQMLADVLREAVHTIRRKRRLGLSPIPELRHRKCRTAKVQVERYLSGDTRFQMPRTKR